MYRRNVKICY